MKSVSIELAAVEEIHPGSPEIWRPNSFQEWIELKRVDAVLDAWSEQARHERALRFSSSRWIFLLIALQVFGIFLFMGLIGLGVMIIDVTVLQVLIGAVCADVFGLGFAVTRFLYREPLKIDLENLLQRAGGQGANKRKPPAS
jgi:hypothetical protein